MRLLLLLLVLFAALPAHAAEPVDVALVLVGDVSRSIDEGEFALEKQGYAAALTSPAVLAAITGGPRGAIAVAYEEFAGANEVRTVVDWAVVSDGESAGAFAARLAAAPRSYVGRTAIGEAIEYAGKLLAAGGFAGARQVIDVCGDGTSNAGRPVAAVRDEAVAAGFVVNGLAIINEHAPAYMMAHTHPPGGLPMYYQDNVIGGPGAFVLQVHDFADFGVALARKLVQEIAARPVQDAGAFAGR
jgi:Protein of unknown function (DUF1194)